MADFLTPADLESFRDFSESAMQDEAIVLVRHEEKDGRARTVTYTQEGDPVKCRKRPATGDDAVNNSFGRETPGDGYIVAVPVGTEVVEGDLLRVTHWEDQTVVDLEVLRQADESTFNAHLGLYCAKAPVLDPHQVVLQP